MSGHNHTELNGPPCPRCARPMEVRQHVQIREKQRRQPFYYSRWYRCNHMDCRTREVMPREFKVWNDNSAADHLRRLLAVREQLRPWDDGLWDNGK